MNKPLIAWKGIEKDEAENVIAELKKYYLVEVSIIKAVSGKWNVYYQVDPGFKINKNDIVMFCKKCIEEYRNKKK